MSKLDSMNFPSLTRVAMVVAVTVALLLAAQNALPEDSVAEPRALPLSGFERLIGSQWHLGGSYQEFEWGLGRQSVKSRSYFVVDGKPKLVSEGSWFWHPGEKQIKGIFTAVDMPVVLFDYTTRFEEDMMLNDLRAYGASGNEAKYLETWEFKGENQYVWRLLRKLPNELKEEMSGTYTRK